MATGGRDEKCGTCKKLVGRNDKGVQCEICEIWYHSKCEDVEDDTYKLLNQDKVHFYCGRCDQIFGKILKSVMEVKKQQEKMISEIQQIKDELKMTNEYHIVEQKHLRSEILEMKNCIEKTGPKQQDEELQKQIKDLTAAYVKDGPWITAVKKEVKDELMTVKEDISESLEIEKRKKNIVIHGLPEVDSERDVEAVMEILEEGLRLDGSRHIDRTMRIGRDSGDRPRPVRIQLKSEDSKKEILARAKNLKDNDKFKRLFITPDLTRKQQIADKELRMKLKEIRDSGESQARIRFGKIVKNGADGRTLVLFPV